MYNVGVNKKAPPEAVGKQAGNAPHKGGTAIIARPPQNYKEEIKMKFKTTQKEIRANYNAIICVPYCGLQNLLNYENPVAYTVRREGWAADIYDMGGGVAIVTGYAPFGNIRPSYELRERYETQAEKIRYDYSLSYDQQRESLKSLARDFIKGVCNHE